MMRKAKVFVHDNFAGILLEKAKNGPYQFTYDQAYNRTPVSLTMPLHEKLHGFSSFPPFFEGLLPEGIMLEGLIRQLKIDRNDYFSQLIAIGEDLVGAVTVKPFEDE